MKASFRSNFIWVAIGNGVYAASRALLLVMLAKRGTPEMVGEFAYALAITSPLYLLLNLQLASAQATDAAEQYSFSEYVSTRAASMILLLAITAALAVAFRNVVSPLVLMLVAGSRVAEGMSDVIYGLLQKVERMRSMGVSLIIRGGVSCVGMYAGLIATGELSGAVWGLAITSTAVLLLYDVPVARGVFRPAAAKGPSRPLLPVMIEIAVLCVPLGIVSFLDALTINIPRYAIRHQLGDSALGYFAAVAYFLVVGGTMVAALAHAAKARLARQFVTDLRAFRHFIGQLMLIAVGIGMAGVLVSVFFGKAVLTLVYTPDYARYAPVLTWTMVAAVIWFAAIVLNTAVTATRIFAVQSIIYVAIALGTLVAAIFLVSAYGLVGGALSLLVAFFARALAMAWLLTRAMRDAHEMEEQALAPAT